jgi:hypothetical protein
MGRFATEWLTRPENLAALASLAGQWIDRAPPPASALLAKPQGYMMAQGKPVIWGVRCQRQLLERPQQRL